MDINDSQIEGDTGMIPEGFVEIMGPNGQRYLVPEFYAPALQNTLGGFEEKKKMDIDKAAGTVSDIYYIPFRCNKAKKPNSLPLGLRRRVSLFIFRRRVGWQVLPFFAGELAVFFLSAGHC